MSGLCAIAGPAAALWLVVAPLLAQNPVLFEVDEGSDPATVTADRPAVSASLALSELGHALGWRVDFATRDVEARLNQVSIDLSLARRNPRTVAHLIAMTGGADVVFDDRTTPAGPKTTLHVVPPPSARTESGAERLRRWAMKWYQSFLSEHLALDPLVSEKGMEVRMHLGHMLLQQGDLRGAIRYFEQIKDTDSSHRYVPLAMLRLAQCHQDLGEFEQAEKLAREVSKLSPSKPETAAATVLLGRNLIAQRRYDECVAVMRSAVLRLANTPEITDVLLIIAEAQRHRERPDYALEQMRMLAESRSFRDLEPRQWLDYHFLRGYGAEGVGKYGEATEMLEIFLATGPADPRRGQALVMLGRAYLAQEKFVEARAAALQAASYQSQMDRFWRKETRILQARTALAVGQRDRAFEELEREVRRDPVQTPELIVFLIKSFIADGRYQKAIATSELLSGQTGPWGDKARYLAVLAMWKQRPRAELLHSFIEHAVKVVPEIADEDLQRRATEIIGQAYGVLGDWQRAIAAYQGVLQ